MKGKMILEVMELSEATEEIVGYWLKEIEGFFVMSNVSARGGRELDFLAISPNGKRRLHVEVRVHVRRSYSKKDWQSQKKEFERLLNDKFDHEHVKQKAKQCFKADEYERLLILGTKDPNREKMESVARAHIKLN